MTLHRCILYIDRNKSCQEITSDPYSLLEDADNWVEILNLDTEEYIVSGTFPVYGIR